VQIVFIVKYLQPQGAIMILYAYCGRVKRIVDVKILKGDLPIRGENGLKSIWTAVGITEMI